MGVKTIPQPFLLGIRIGIQQIMFVNFDVIFPLGRGEAAFPKVGEFGAQEEDVVVIVVVSVIVGGCACTLSSSTVGGEPFVIVRLIIV